jgi:hypothetical protein
LFTWRLTVQTRLEDSGGGVTVHSFCTIMDCLCLIQTRAKKNMLNDLVHIASFFIEVVMENMRNDLVHIASVFIKVVMCCAGGAQRDEPHSVGVAVLRERVRPKAAGVQPDRARHHGAQGGRTAVGADVRRG